MTIHSYKDTKKAGQLLLKSEMCPIHLTCGGCAREHVLHFAPLSSYTQQMFGEMNDDGADFHLNAGKVNMELLPRVLRKKKKKK